MYPNRDCASGGTEHPSYCSVLANTAREWTYGPWAAFLQSSCLGHLTYQVKQCVDPNTSQANTVSDERAQDIDQLGKIFAALGTPTEETWPVCLNSHFASYTI